MPACGQTIVEKHTGFCYTYTSIYGEYMDNVESKGQYD